MVFFKWILDRLRRMGLLSSATANLKKTDGDSGRCCAMPSDGKAGSCCAPSDSSFIHSVEPIDKADRKTPGANFIHIDSMEEWNNLVAESGKAGSAIIVDFTASWCKPCKTIAPFFESLAGKYDAVFVKVDVDELDEIAQRAKVSMMPTFVVYQGERELEQLQGANETKLAEMVGRHCSSFKENSSR
jgi:thiol-disulfide isomerase/thioredoxin